MPSCSPQVGAGAVQPVGEAAVDDVVEQGALAGAGDAGDADKQSQRDAAHRYFSDCAAARR